MTSFVQLLSSGLALGAVYALVALGFVIIYRASQVFNFAQGELLTVGALSMVSLRSAGLPWAVAAALSILFTGLLAATVERVVLRPLVGRPVFTTVIVTIFVGFLIRSGALLAWGSGTYGMPTPWPTDATVQLGEARLLVNALVTVGGCLVVLGGFYLLVRFSRVGVAMRATASDQETALALGIPVGRIFGVVWFLAGATAAIGGICLSFFPRSADISLGFVALRAFPAVIVGGLDSVWGTVLAAAALGVLEVLTQAYVNPNLGAFGHNFHTVLPYFVMVAVLVVRPYGLFGTPDVERV
ncbi:MAG: branched-chain amino acid ABC transporter permease [Myxococcales bacterium]|nr:branched-chain amino acid ABC transporter permease [Myxococcales bacterium]